LSAICVAIFAFPVLWCRVVAMPNTIVAFLLVQCTNKRLNKDFAK
jgi:hypothetical protein